VAQPFHLPVCFAVRLIVTVLVTDSIIRIVTDRFAPPSSDAPALTSGLVSPYTCAAGAGTYCGGNWRSIIDKLDYIEGMGFDAIWISPISRQYQDISPAGPSSHSSQH
jgi:alpha-amylase